jgi:maltose alpha-D-glucosyltransferase/alpha-amylase
MEPWITSLRNGLHQHSAQLTTYLIRQRWYRSKARRLIRLETLDLAAASVNSSQTVAPPVVLAFLQCTYEEGADEVYVLPLRLRAQNGSSQTHPEEIFACEFADHTFVVSDATQDEEGSLLLAEGIRLHQEWPGLSGRVHFAPTSAGESLLMSPLGEAHAVGAEQSNSSVTFDRRLLLKLFRKLEPGLHPDFEIMEFLTSRTPGAFPNVPTLAGHIRYEGKSYSAVVGLLEEFVPNAGDGWSYTLQHLRALLATASKGPEDVSLTQIEELVNEESAEFLAAMGHLGDITAKLHLALASDLQTEGFRPEPIRPEDVTTWRRAMEDRIEAVFGLLLAKPDLRSSGLSDHSTRALQLACHDRVQCVSLLVDGSLMKIRQHGDYHLGQILKIDRRAGPESLGFVILDFEGEPARSLQERRSKQCTLKDLAGMLRSFNYAAEAVVREQPASSASQARCMRRVLQTWEQMAGRVFLEHYRRTVGSDARILPREELLDPVLQAFQIDKAVYELGYEINNRPAWAGIPLTALQRLCEA